MQSRFRDRWVSVYVLFCLAQLPLYLTLGKGPVTYDLAIESAEQALVQAPAPEQIAGVRDDLETCERALQRIPGGVQDSRQARLDVTAATLAWQEGNTAAADAFFRKSLEGFEATHGPDALQTCLVSLRYAEFLFVVRRYDEALLRFELGVKSLEETMGPGSTLATRAAFDHVSLLTEFGRRGEAVERAGPRLDDLLEHAGKLDEMFLARAGKTLDLLGAEGLRKPPDGGTWQQALTDAHEQGKPTADLDEAQ